MASEHLRALRDGLGWQRSTAAIHFVALRQFLRWVGNPLAEDRGAWRLPSGEASHRRWLDAAQLTRLLRAAKGPERVIIALEGYNALRRVELIRLHVRDIDLERKRVRVCGKGRSGGKWRTIPLTEVSIRELRIWVRGRAADAPLLGRSASWVDLRLSEAAKRANLGVRVSNHDLRRTFGRLAYQSGMGLVDLKNVMGHPSVDMTTHYIGVDEEQMRDGLACFDAQMSGEGPHRARPQRVPRRTRAGTSPSESQTHTAP